MSVSSAELPATRWELTAPESHVLLKGPSGAGLQAFKLGVFELVSQGALRLVEVQESGMLGRKKKTTVLAAGARSTTSTSPSLTSLLDVFRGAKTKSFSDGTVGVPVADFAAAARKRYSTFDQYVTKDVLPALIQRGLFVQEEKRTLGLFKSKKTVLTPTGQVARGDLEQWLDAGKVQIGRNIDANPQQALALTAMAGSALLLMDGIHPDLRRLSTHFDPATTSLNDLYTEYEEDGMSFDPSSFDFNWDFDVFDSLDSAFDSIDSAFDSSDMGSDSGSDSGGGGD